MAAIRGKDTKPEMIVRKYLFSRGFRYRLNHPRLPGHPDIVLRKYRTVVFVNGCFWHGRILASEDRAEQGAGQAGAAWTGEDGVALHYGMGVWTEADCAWKDVGILGVHLESYLSERPFHCPLWIAWRSFSYSCGAGARIWKEIKLCQNINYKYQKPWLTNSKFRLRA